MSIEQRLLVRQNIEQIGSDVDDVSRVFYRELFQLDNHMKAIFSGNIVFLNRKFSNLINTLRNVKHLEKIADSIYKMGERHLHNYGAQVEHFPTIKKALILALDDYFKSQFTDELKEAWSTVFDEVAEIMSKAMSQSDRRQAQRTTYDDDTYDPDLLEAIGGAEVVKQVHLRFYDVIFEHPWLGQFFLGKWQSVLAEKQTQFMVSAFGGPNNYKGDTPAFVHMHMYITDEMADLREELLRQAILDEGLSEDIAERWLKVDHAFRDGIVKNSVEECVMKCQGQLPVTAKKPQHF